MRTFISKITILSIVFTSLPTFAFAQATIPPGCTTPGDCDDITPSFQGINVKTNGLIDNQGDLRLGEADGNGTNFIGIQAPASIASDVTLTLPNALGTNGQVLTTDASGNLTWTTPTTTTYSAGNGLNLTSTTFSLDVNSLTSDGLNNASDQVVVYDADTSSVRKISRSTFLSPVLGALVYQGSWNATTNTPTLSDATGTQGQYYIVTVADTRNLGSGIITFNIGDYVIHNGTRYELLENASAVPSVFGRTGPVTAQAGDYTATQITNTPAGSVAATTTQNAINELDTEKLARDLVTGSIWVGNGSNQANSVVVSGDATLANNGALTIANDAITSTKILNNAVTSTKIATNSIDGTKIALGSDAQGDTMYYNGTDWIRLPKGTAGQVLTMNTGATAPEWAAAAAGSTTLAALTDVDVTGLTTGAILYYNGTDWIDIGIGTAGQALVVNPGATAPIWSNITGQVVDYGMLTIASGVTVPAAGNAIPLNNSAGNITATSNTITLSAGKTYKLSASVARINGSAGSAELTYQFRNTTTNTDLGSPGTLAQNTNLGWGGDAQAIITPLTTTNVQLWVKKNISAGTFDSNNGTNAGTVIVQQLGSSATTVFTGANGTVAGTAGFIPAPAATDNTKYLKGDGTWSTVSGGSSTLAALTDVDVTGSATGAMLYYNGTDWIGISIGTAGQALVVNPGATAPEWSNITGQIVDYVRATQASNQNLATGNAVNYSANVVGNITNLGNGRFRLSAGKTYSLAAYWSPVDTSDDYGQIQWYNVTGAAFVGTVGLGGDPANINALGIPAKHIFTPSVATDVEVRMTSDNATGSDFAKNWMEIIQLGSSATTVFTGANGTVAGTAGFIPAPAPTDNTKYLKGDGTWSTVSGATGYSSLDVSNLASGGSIGSAATTVDLHTNFNINQTTAGQTITIPSPTDTNATKGKLITINNVGSANFTLGGVTVPAGSYGSAFVWNGTVWNPINAASNVAASYMNAGLSTSYDPANGNFIGWNTNVASAGDDITLVTGSTVGNSDTSRGIFTLKGGKTYKLSAATAFTDGSSSTLSIRWQTVSGTTGTDISSAAGGANMNSLGTVRENSHAEVIYTPTLDTKVGLKLTGSDPASVYAQSSWATIEVIGGNSPVVGATTLATLTDVDVTGSATGAMLYYNGTDWVDIGIGTAGQALVVNPGATAPIWSNITGQTVDYVYARLTGTQVVSASNTDVTTFVTSSGNIPHTSGVFTLVAGKTYELDAALYFSGSTGGGTSSYVVYDWVDAVSNVPLDSSGGAGLVSWGGDTASAWSQQNSAKLIYTPVANQTVKVRVTALSGFTDITLSSASGNNAGTYATIKQLGSSATTVFTGANGTVAGTAGFIPAPAATDNTKFLKGDGTWATVLNDQTGSRYIDIGNTRIQWGTASTTSSVTSVTLPAAFANTSYVVTVNPRTSGNTSYLEAVSAEPSSSTAFNFTTTYYNGSFGSNNGRTINWMAIGPKP